MKSKDKQNPVAKISGPVQAKGRDRDGTGSTLLLNRGSPSIYGVPQLPET